MSTTPNSLKEVLDILTCPVTHSPLKLDGNELVSTVGGLRYPILDGIPKILPSSARLPQGISSLEEFKQRYAADI